MVFFDSEENRQSKCEKFKFTKWTTGLEDMLWCTYLYIIRVIFIGEDCTKKGYRYQQPIRVEPSMGETR